MTKRRIQIIARRFFAVVFLSLTIISGSIGQSASVKVSTKKVKDGKYGETGNLDKARFQINDIKSRGLIVRLKTSTDRIEAYRKAGYKSLADKVEIKARANNLLLMYAFITQWSYCPVYFMESQYTPWLMTQDTAVIKTADLKRDTSIYMNHDSFYILDMGDLMASDYDPNHPIRQSRPSSTPMAGVYFVVKDGKQEQLQSPMPHEAKLWLEEFTSTDKIKPMELRQGLVDSVQNMMRKYPGMKELLKSEGKEIVNDFLRTVYLHTEVKVSEVQNATTAGEHSNLPIQAGAYTARGGNPQQQAAKRLDKAFIDYFCKRADKDRNIIYDNDPIYWWMRNPNIQYMPYLQNLEVELKLLLDKDPNPTK